MDSAREQHFPLVLLCFFLSGLAGLVYQTSWTREFAFVFGTSEMAIVTVLAAYMAGLAAGAVVAARITTRIRRPVLVYGLLELGVGLAALAVPYAIRAAVYLQAAAFGGSEGPPPAGGLATIVFYSASSFAILMVPTGLMGATLPLLARYAVRHENEIGSRIGVLYGVNTLGAVVGTVVAGFLLLPALGLRRTILVGVGANLLVFVAAAYLARKAVRLEPAPRSMRWSPTGSRFWILPAICLSGAASFTYEVLWSRLLSHILGGSVYAFATMLASFLAGIAIGSSLASRIASNPRRAAAGFAWSQFGTAVLSLGAFHLLDLVPTIERALGATGGARLGEDVLAAALTLLPGALCIGATFPLAVRMLAYEAQEAGPASARVYAWNTVGAILGAICAGFLVLPAVGYEGTLRAAVAANLVLALAAPLLFWGASKVVIWVAAAALIAVAAVPLEPPWRVLRSSSIQPGSTPGDVVYYGVGRSATVLLLETMGGWELRTNGLPESRISPRGASNRKNDTGHWLGALGTLARPEADTMLVVGLGGGTTLESVPSFVETVDVVELEQKVVEANRTIADLRRENPLSDPRVRVIGNDARSALFLTRARYDIVVSQPSHPWTSGASHLYSLEFFELVRERLENDGAFVQWMGLRFVDEAILRSLMATLSSVFPHVQVFQVDGDGILFLASGQPLLIAENAPRAIERAPEEFQAMGLVRVEDLLASLRLDEDGVRAFAEGAPRSTDDRNLLQMRSPGVFREGRGVRNADALFAPHEPIPTQTPGVEATYLVRRLLEMGFVERAHRVARHIEGPAGRAAADGLVELAGGSRLSASRKLGEAVSLDPGLLEARAALLRLQWKEGLEAVDGSDLPEAWVAGSERSLRDAWRYQAANDWEGVRVLDDQLEEVAPQHPLYRDAVRLRAGWRVRIRESGRALEAMDLLDAMIPMGGTALDKVARARVAARSGLKRAALFDLHQASQGLAKDVDGPAAAREALPVLRSLPPAEVDPWDRRRLEVRFRRVADAVR